MICPQSTVRSAADELGGVFLLPQATDGLTRLAESLPDVAAGQILECRLDGGPGTADYSVAVMRGAERFQTLANAGASDAAVRLLHAGDADETVGIIWLEFDVDAKGAASDPSFFVASLSRPTPANDAAKLAGILSRAVSGSDFTDQVAGFLTKLPDEVFLRQTGMMAGRGSGTPDSLRLVLDGVAGGAVLSLLKTVGWPGELEHANKLASLLRNHAEDAICKIDLDLADELAPTLGVELPADVVAKSPAILDALEGAGIATNAKSERAREFLSRRVIDEFSWDGRPMRLDFGLNHLKLSCVAGAKTGIQAKAYFSFTAIPDFGAPVNAPSRAH